MRNEKERLDFFRIKITKSFSKLNAISRIFGLSLGPIELSSKKKINIFSWLLYALLNILVVLVCSYLAEYGILGQPQTKKNNKTTKVESNIRHTKLIGSVIIVLILILLTPFTRKDLVNSLEELARIDNRLDMEFHLRLDYKKSSRRSIYHLVIAFCSVLFMKIRIVWHFIHAYDRIALWFFLAMYATFTKIVIAIQFITLLLNLRDRFLLLNSRLEKLLPEVQQDIVKSSFRECCTIYRTLRIVAEIHQDLTEASAIVNKAFGIQMLVDLSYTFMMITCELYSTIMTLFIDWNVAIIRVNWSILHAIQWICIVAACNSVIRQMRKVIVVVHKISLNCLNLYSHAVAQDLFYKEPHQKFEFTAYGFFVIDSTVITSVVASVTTYLVFLIQIDSSPFADKDTYINVTTSTN